MPKKGATTWSGGSVKLDTADKKQLVATPQQQHNLSIAPNRNVLLTAPPNRGKSSLCLQILARSAPFHSVYVLHGTPGTNRAAPGPARRDCLHAQLRGAIDDFPESFASARGSSQIESLRG